MKNPIHKVTAMLLTCTLLGSPMLWLNTPAAYAEAAPDVQSVVTKEQAVQTARLAANLPESKWTLINSEYRTSAKDNWGNTLSPRWQLDFNQQDSKTYAGANVILDATTGKLVSMNRYSKDPLEESALTKEQAQQKAEDFIKQVAPQEFKETELTSSNVDGIGAPYKYFNFTYERKTADGVFVLDDEINVTVQGDGSVSAYTCNWTNVTLPPAAGTVPKERATSAYSDALDLHLSYQFSYKTNLPTVNLVYSNSMTENFMFLTNTAPLLIDAKTGQMLDRYGKATTPTKMSIAPLDPKGPTAPTPRTTSMTQVEAEALIKSSALLQANMELDEATYSENGTKSWSFSIRNSTSKTNIGRVSLDAMTGELMNFNSYSETSAPPSSSPVSDETIKAKALELVKKLYSGRTGSIAFINVVSIGDNPKQSGSTMKGVAFSFLKNGVPSPNGLQIVFDAQGNVNNFYGNTYYGNDVESQIVYPDPSKAITLDKAKDTFLKNRPVRLSYYFPIAADGTRANTPVLVYAPNDATERSAHYVDGLTGEWISLDPSTQKPPALPSDLNGHWAEKALTEFANLGLLELKDGKANPDGEITRGEFIHLLANVRGGLNPSEMPTFEDVPTDSKYYSAIETAVLRGWIAPDSKFRPAAKISRQEVATILTRVLGHEELAKHSEIFTLPYSDGDQVSTWAKGSVAILNGLGVMRGSYDRFAPHGNVTLAETCTALLKIQSYNTPMPYYK
ncbi:S-layer homology domain-containing protein [Tumebacillus permanentifrigoris]|uniref:S-layer family protein n=1 Tax=Tumebacillus permanentifrigoris TaxID=378543 RepID=A0A316DWG2_9BACL|nr:S-layer homology domain-containing protein [Tumebacillus permanentifrigoris]PWK13904.1 S-layer family protein [Tumebacillus permanentifrigoris]